MLDRFHNVTKRLSMLPSRIVICFRGWSHIGMIHKLMIASAGAIANAKQSDQSRISIDCFILRSYLSP